MSLALSPQTFSLFPPKREKKLLFFFSSFGGSEYCCCRLGAGAATASSVGPLERRKSARSLVLVCSKAPSRAPALPRGMRETRAADLVVPVAPGVEVAAMGCEPLVCACVVFVRASADGCWVCDALMRFAAAPPMGRGELFAGGSWLRRNSASDSSCGRWLLRGRAARMSSSSSSSEGMA
jgi:hypothetical protein